MKEKKNRKQTKREDGQLLILPSVTEEAGALSGPTFSLSSEYDDRLLYKATALDAPANTSAEQSTEGGSLSSERKGTEESGNKQEISEKSADGAAKKPTRAEKAKAAQKKAQDGQLDLFATADAIAEAIKPEEPAKPAAKWDLRHDSNTGEITMQRYTENPNGTRTYNARGKQTFKNAEEALAVLRNPANKMQPVLDEYEKMLTNIAEYDAIQAERAAEAAKPVTPENGENPLDFADRVAANEREKQAATEPMMTAEDIAKSKMPQFLKDNALNYINGKRDTVTENAYNVIAAERRAEKKKPAKRKTKSETEKKAPAAKKTSEKKAASEKKSVTSQREPAKPQTTEERRAALREKLIRQKEEFKNIGKGRLSSLPVDIALEKAMKMAEIMATSAEIGYTYLLDGITKAKEWSARMKEELEAKEAKYAEMDKEAGVADVGIGETSTDDLEDDDVLYRDDEEDDMSVRAQMERAMTGLKAHGPVFVVSSLEDLETNYGWMKARRKSEYNVLVDYFNDPDGPVALYMHKVGDIIVFNRTDGEIVGLHSAIIHEQVHSAVEKGIISTQELVDFYTSGNPLVMAVDKDIQSRGYKGLAVPEETLAHVVEFLTFDFATNSRKGIEVCEALENDPKVSTVIQKIQDFIYEDETRADKFWQRAVNARRRGAGSESLSSREDGNASEGSRIESQNRESLPGGEKPLFRLADEAEAQELEKEPTVRVYRAMQLVENEDG